MFVRMRCMAQASVYVPCDDDARMVRSPHVAQDTPAMALRFCVGAAKNSPLFHSPPPHTNAIAACAYGATACPS